MKPDTKNHYRERVIGAVAPIQATLDEAFDGVALGKRARLAPLHIPTDGDVRPGASTDQGGATDL